MSRHFSIYGKPSCPFCNKAIDAITSRGDTFEYFDVNKNAEWKQFLIDRGLIHVPQIYIEETGEHIGGYTDLVKWYHAN